MVIRQAGERTHKHTETHTLRLHRFPFCFLLVYSTVFLALTICLIRCFFHFLLFIFLRRTKDFLCVNFNDFCKHGEAGPMRCGHSASGQKVGASGTVDGFILFCGSECWQLGAWMLHEVPSKRQAFQKCRFLTVTRKKQEKTTYVVLVHLIDSSTVVPVSGRHSVALLCLSAKKFWLDNRL